jgi:hypothetical protein
MEGNTNLVFRVTQESDGGYCAECLTEGIFTQGNTWEELGVHDKGCRRCLFFR